MQRRQTSLENIAIISFFLKMTHSNLVTLDTENIWLGKTCQKRPTFLLAFNDSNNLFFFAAADLARGIVGQSNSE